MNGPMKRQVMNVWEWRLGTSAALAYWGWIRWTIWGRQSLFLFAALFALGVHFHSALIEVLSYSIFVFMLISVIRIQPPAKRRLMAAGSKALGVNITKQNFPPRSTPRYQEWCAKNGIVPGHYQMVDC
jgi:hypothetical protein